MKEINFEKEFKKLDKEADKIYQHKFETPEKLEKACINFEKRFDEVLSLYKKESFNNNN